MAFTGAALALVLALAQVSGCSLDGAPEATQSTELSVAYQPVLQTERNVWDITVADFDRDGDQDLFIGGHGEPRHRDRIHYFENGAYTTDDFDFRRSPDRHGCAAADVNADGAIDVYCASGARRGSGGDANELWLGMTDPDSLGQFSRVKGAAGADYITSRGRRSVFLRANADELPDLYVTIWGERNDDLPNESALFINRAGTFERVESNVNGPWGGRCVAGGDVTGNGLDDVVACNATQGAELFINRADRGKEGDFRRIELPWRASWWMALTLFDSDEDGRLEIAGIRRGPNGGWLFVIEYDPETEALKILREISFASAFDDCAPHSLAIEDITGDGAPEVYVTRNSVPSNTVQCEHGTDAIFLGPDWSHYIPVLDGGRKTPATAYAANGHFLRATAGPDWQGLVDTVTLVSKPASESQSEQITPQRP